MEAARDTTVWVLGDQLGMHVASLEGAAPSTTRILVVESAAKVTSKPWHRQRLHLVLSAMRRFARELSDRGFDVDHRRADSLTAGLSAHVEGCGPRRVRVMEPMSWDGLALLERLAADPPGGAPVEIVRSNQFLCHRDEFATWADGRGGARLRMEDFYRWQRVRTGYLMDGDEPAGGRWNLDEENREPPPRDGRSWPAAVVSQLDDLDREVVAGLPEGVVGAAPTGIWPTSRRAALTRLRRFVDEGLPVFGAHQDAMLGAEWKLAHSLLSSSLNLGLLQPAEVCDAVEVAYREGRVPLAAAEGVIRQIIGWREYVWGVYWRQMPGYRDLNELGATRPLPPLFEGAPTDMACVANVMGHVHDHAYAHHIERLMVIGNLCLLAGVRPSALVEWMWANFVDGAEWVMLPNVVGMALHADGGRMATKPYAGGGAYISRMSDHCRGCRFDPKKRTGDDACPFTTLYWDFVARHEQRWIGNHRMRNPLAGMRRLSDLDEVRVRAAAVLARLDDGTL